MQIIESPRGHKKEEATPAKRSPLEQENEYSRESKYPLTCLLPSDNGEQIPTVSAQARFKHLESVIERGLTSFIEVGSALLEIRENRLYKRSYRTFEDYCRKRWGMSRQHASRLIGSMEVTMNLSPIGDTLPRCEAVARPLVGLPPEQQVEVWSQVLETVTGDPTGADVQRVTDQVLAENKRLREIEAEVIREPEPEPEPRQKVQAVGEDATDEELDTEFNRSWPRVFYSYLRMFSTNQREVVKDKIRAWIRQEEEDRP